MRDALPAKIHKRECGFVNLDDDVGDGTHWTSYIKRDKQIHYFDSIGQLKPPIEVIKYFRSDGSSNSIHYNFDKLQNLNTYNCGHLALAFLYYNTTTIT